MGMIADKLPRTFDRGTMCSIGHSRFLELYRMRLAEKLLLVMFGISGLFLLWIGLLLAVVYGLI